MNHFSLSEFILHRGKWYGELTCVLLLTPLRAPASAAGGRGYDKSLHSYRIHHLQQVARELVIRKHEGYYFLCCNVYSLFIDDVENEEFLF